ncbi:hypothetical protein MRX96_001994 [Rhipicephalus microplus]
MQRRQRECPSSCPSRSSVALLSLPGSPRIVAAASASSTTSMGTSRTLSWPRDSSRLFQCWHHARRGQTVRLRFASSQPPDRDTLSRLQLQVRHARPRPLQCGRFGHVSEACLRAGACIRCGRQHPSADSCNPRCVNYGGGAFSRHADLSSLAGGAESGHAAGHGANTALETGGQGCSTRGLFLRCCGRANLPESPSKDPGLQRPHARAAPIFPATGEPSTTSSLPATPAEPAEDPRDALIASLLAALRAIGDALPVDHPLRAVCLTALGGQPGSTQLK